MLESIKSTWKIRDSRENAMLELYRNLKGGDIIAEVRVATRSLDGVHLSVGRKDGQLYRWKDLGGNFLNVIQGHDIELIEVKCELTRGVIGQAIAGRDLFEERFSVASFGTHVVFPIERGDPTLEWVCKEKRNIHIEPLESVSRVWELAGCRAPVSSKGSRSNRISEAKTPDKFEMLRRYQDRPNITGDIYTGIRIDDSVIWPGCNEDSVDAVRLLHSQGKGNLFSPITEEAFRKRVQSCEVELIEMSSPLLKSDSKRKEKIGALNRSAFGRVLAGKDMFERKFREENIKVSQLVILCAEIDPSFKVVWEKQGILPLVV